MSGFEAWMSQNNPTEEFEELMYKAYYAGQNNQERSLDTVKGESYHRGFEQGYRAAQKDLERKQVEEFGKKWGSSPMYLSARQSGQWEMCGDKHKLINDLILFHHPSVIYVCYKIGSVVVAQNTSFVENKEHDNEFYETGSIPG